MTRVHTHILSRYGRGGGGGGGGGVLACMHMHVACLKHDVDTYS